MRGDTGEGPGAHVTETTPHPPNVHLLRHTTAERLAEPIEEEWDMTATERIEEKLELMVDAVSSLSSRFAVMESQVGHVLAMKDTVQAIQLEQVRLTGQLALQAQTSTAQGKEMTETKAELLETKKRVTHLEQMRWQLIGAIAAAMAILGLLQWGLSYLK